jgi:hypothetical protein
LDAYTADLRRARKQALAWWKGLLKTEAEAQVKENA